MATMLFLKQKQKQKKIDIDKNKKINMFKAQIFYEYKVKYNIIRAGSINVISFINKYLCCCYYVVLLINAYI